MRYLPAPTPFGYYLGGVTAVDSSWASVTQLMDAHKRRWSREVLAPRDTLAHHAAHRRPGHIVGDLRSGIAESVGIDPARIVAVGSHDTASAYAAAPVSNACPALIISSGTWSLIGKLLRKPLTGPEAMAAN